METGHRSIRHRSHARSGTLVGVVALERLVGFLFDEARSGCQADRLLEPCTFIIEPIDGARELDERAAEIIARVAFADRILDVPERRVHLLELGAELVQLRAVCAVEADGSQGAKLAQHILELARVLDALGLYFQDGDLVHQLAGRDRHENVLRREVPGCAHVPPSTFAAARAPRSTIPPVSPTPVT